MFATRQHNGFADENKRAENGSKAAVPAKGVAANAAGRQQATRAAQASNRRALGDIGNLVGAMSVRCNVAKDGVLENAVVKQAVLHAEGITRPITRKFGASLLNSQAAARAVQAVAPEPVPAVVQVEVKVAEDSSTWGATKRRTLQAKAKESSTATSESQAISGDSQSSSSVSNVQPAARPKSRNKVVKKEKEQTLTSLLTARSEAACGVFDAEMHEAQSEPVPNIDEHDTGNQLCVVEYIEDIYSFYRKTEVQSCVPADYMSRQSDINEKMRAILIDWLIEVHLKFKLMPETLYLTTNLIDRYLSVNSVSRKNLQLVGVTAMLLAAKYEEIWAPEVQDFVFISDNAYSRDQVLTMEKNMLNSLKFNLTVPTPYVFMVRLLKAAACEKQEKTVSAQLEMVSWFLVELCLTEYPMIKYAPSLTAAAAIFAAQTTLGRTPCWGPALQRHSGYTEAQIMECATLMATLHSKAGEGNLTVVHKKYSAPKFGSVAKLAHAASLCPIRAALSS